MPSRNRSRRFSIDSGTPPSDRGPARQGRPTGREANRSLARAGTRGSESGFSSLALWSLAFVAVAVVVVVVTLVVLGSKSSAGSANVVAPAVVTPSNVRATGRTLGNPSAAITVDLYGDFRCSACYDFTTGGTEQNLVANYVATSKVKLVWHDFLSIDKIQGNNASRDAANAAWCAADQGKFWVIHDWLYANDGAGSEDPSLFSATRLSAIGKAAGLDMSSFQPCLDSGTHLAAITAEDQATPSQVTGTPAVLVNGNPVGNPGYTPTYDEIKAYIDSLG
jgi:protein-disulfide isomerase